MKMLMVVMVKNKVDCDSAVDGDSGNKNNSGTDNGGVNINSCDDANCGDGESILGCGEDKDVGDGDHIGDHGVDTNGGSDPNLEDSKTKVGSSDNISVTRFF